MREWPGKGSRPGSTDSATVAGISRTLTGSSTILAVDDRKAGLSKGHVHFLSVEARAMDDQSVLTEFLAVIGRYDH